MNPGQAGQKATCCATAPGDGEPPGARRSRPARMTLATITAADAGVHTFTVILRSSGTQTITAQDTATSSITGSATVKVLRG